MTFGPPTRDDAMIHQAGRVDSRYIGQWQAPKFAAGPSEAWEIVAKARDDLTYVRVWIL